MKVQIEKVSKIKAFEPFDCVITFETPEEANNVLNYLCSRDHPYDSSLMLPSRLFEIYDKIRTELSNQGYVTDKSVTDKLGTE